MKMTLSLNGVKFIASFEGFRGACYDDATNNCTIGYGHLVHRGKTTAHDRKVWGTISRKRGLELLHADAQLAAGAVRKYVKVPLTQAQFDALVSLGYNCGTGAIIDLAKVVNTKPLKRRNAWRRPAWRRHVYTEITKWCHGEVNGKMVVIQGLLRRRIAEATLFTKGKYTRAQGNKSANL